MHIIIQSKAYVVGDNEKPRKKSILKVVASDAEFSFSRKQKIT
jgi:hypothetical protein